MLFSADGPEISNVQSSHFVITGASGMLGKAIVRMIYEQMASLEKAATFEFFLRKGTPNPFSNIIPEANIRVVEIGTNAWRPREKEFNLLHFASPASPTKYSSMEDLVFVNVGLMKNIVENGHPSLILLASTGEVYAKSKNEPLSETSKLKPSSFTNRGWYPSAKILAETWLRENSEDFGFDYIVSRIFHTFGPGLRPDDGRSFADFLWAAARSEKILLRSTGDQVRSFAYLQDTVEAILLALDLGENTHSYNVGSEKPMMIREFAQKISVISGSEIIYNSQSHFPDPEYTPSPNDYLVPDLSKIRKLGWTPKISLEEGITRTIKAFRSV